MKKLILTSILTTLTITTTFAQELSDEQLTKTAIKDVDIEWANDRDFSKLTRYDVVEASIQNFANKHYSEEKRSIYLKAAKAELDRLTDAESN
jgi:hypothetical protein